MSVLVNSAALLVPFTAAAAVVVVVVVISEVVVKSLLACNGLVLLVNNENVIESIDVHHSVTVNLDILFIRVSNKYMLCTM